MDFYRCPYVDVVPFRNGNEYDECYRCEATGKTCDACQCKLTPEQAESLFAEKGAEYGKPEGCLIKLSPEGGSHFHRSHKQNIVIDEQACSLPDSKPEKPYKTCS